jgi:hypothetical protein
MQTDTGDMSGDSQKTIDIDLEIVPLGVEAWQIMQVYRARQILAEEVHHALHGITVAGDLCCVKLQAAVAVGGEGTTDGDGLSVFFSGNFELVGALRGEPQIVEFGVRSLEALIEVLGECGKSQRDLVTLAREQVWIAYCNAAGGCRESANSADSHQYDWNDELRPHIRGLTWQLPTLRCESTFSARSDVIGWTPGLLIEFSANAGIGTGRKEPER